VAATVGAGCRGRDPRPSRVLRRGVGPLRIALFGLAVASIALTGDARARLDGTSFVSEAWRIEMTAPRGWQVSERSSYPNVLLWMARRNPHGRMLLTAERLRRSEDVLSYARRTAATLATMGFRVRAPQLHSATGA